MAEQPLCDVCDQPGRWIGPLPGQQYASAACDHHTPTDAEIQLLEAVATALSSPPGSRLFLAADRLVQA